MPVAGMAMNEFNLDERQCKIPYTPEHEWHCK